MSDIDNYIVKLRQQFNEVLTGNIDETDKLNQEFNLTLDLLIGEYNQVMAIQQNSINQIIDIANKQYEELDKKYKDFTQSRLNDQQEKINILDMAQHVFNVAEEKLKNDHDLAMTTLASADKVIESQQQLTKIQSITNEIQSDTVEKLKANLDEIKKKDGNGGREKAKKIIEKDRPIMQDAINFYQKNKDKYSSKNDAAEKMIEIIGESFYGQTFDRVRKWLKEPKKPRG